jgi:hypothetical protein
LTGQLEIPKEHGPGPWNADAAGGERAITLCGTDILLYGA